MHEWIWDNVIYWLQVWLRQNFFRPVLFYFWLWKLKGTEFIVDFGLFQLSFFFLFIIWHLCQGWDLISLKHLLKYTVFINLGGLCWQIWILQNFCDYKLMFLFFSTSEFGINKIKTLASEGSGAHKHQVQMSGEGQPIRRKWAFTLFCHKDIWQPPPVP